ncbi:MAG: uracil-DNA glycosylase [bacterium]
MTSKVCKWYNICPIKSFFEKGFIDEKLIDKYCFNSGENCRRFKMEEDGIFEPYNMLPNGEIDANLK